MNEKKRILIVDDDFMMLESLVRITSTISQDYEVIAADSGANGIKKFHEFSPLVVVSDFQLRDMNGLEMLESMGFYPDAEFGVIVVTGLIEIDVYDKIIEKGIDGFLRKGFAAQEYICLLKSLVNAKSNERNIKIYNQNLKAITNNSISSYLLLNKNLNIIEFNNLADEYSIKFLDKNLNKNIHFMDFFFLFEEKENLQSCIKTALNGAASLHEYSIIHNNNKLWFEISINPIFDVQFNVEYINISYTDITDHKLKIDTISRNETLLLGAQKISRVGTWEVNLENKKIYWSEVTKLIHEVPLDYEPTFEEAVGFYVGDSKEILEKAIQQLIENRVEYDLSLQFMTYLGNLIQVRTIGIPEVINDKVTKIYGLFQDISEQVKYLNEIKTQQAELTAMIDNLNESIWSIDAKYNLIRANYNYLKFYKNITGKAIKSGDYCFDGMAEKEIQFWKKNYNKGLTGEKYFFYYELNSLSDVKFFEIHLMPIYNEEIIIGINLIARDITWQKLQENELLEHKNHLQIMVQEQTKDLEKEIKLRRHAEQELLLSFENEKRMNEMKSQFVKMISHEFRTPLSQIMMSNDIIQSTLEKTMNINNEKLNKFFENSTKSVEQMTKIIDISTEFFTLQETFSTNNFTKFNFINHVKILIDVLKTRNNNLFTINFICNFNPGYYYSDEKMIEHIFHQLLDNSFKYSKADKPITIICDKFDNFVVLKIIDFGISIPEDERGIIFDLFYRGKNEQNIGQNRGLGVGLTIVKLCVENLKGSIEYSREEENNVFTIYLPLEDFEYENG